MISGIMSSIANFATLIVYVNFIITRESNYLANFNISNDPDFSRFARKPSDALWSQLITIPIGFAITSFIGIIVSSSSTVIYGETIWGPLDILSNFLSEGGSGTRAGVFFIAFAFSLAQLGTNIAANSVSAGSDLTALLPRFINIRRGGFVCAAIGLAMCPWNLLSSSNNFTTYLSSYAVFLSSIAGVLISDYYLVRKGYLRVKDLYDGRKRGPYFYIFGMNPRAYGAYVAGILINVVGFAGAIGRSVPLGAQYIYKLARTSPFPTNRLIFCSYSVNFFSGFIVSSFVYYLLNRVWPVPAISTYWREVGDEITDLSLVYDDHNDADSDFRKSDVESGSVRKYVVDEKEAKTEE